MRKAKTERKPKNLGEAMGLNTKFDTRKIDFIFGIVLVVVAIYCFVVMASYLSTGASDQSVLEFIQNKGSLVEDNGLMQNKGKMVGAWISYYLVNVNFGLPAFLIPLFIMLCGLKIIAFNRINLWKWFMYLTIVMVWCSIAFAKMFTPYTQDWFFNPGGNHGLYCVQHIENWVGSPGLIAVLVITALTFLTVLSSQTIVFVRRILNPAKLQAISFKSTDTSVNSAITDKRKEDNKVENTPETDKADNNAKAENDSKEKNVPETIDLTPVFHEVSSTNSNDTKVPETENTATHVPVQPVKPTFAVTSTPVNPTKVNHESEAVQDTVHDLSVKINPLEPFTRYKYPTLDILKKYADNTPQIHMDELKANNDRIIEVLNSFGVQISSIKATVGPTITLYEITPAEGVRISKIKNLEDDIALSLAARGIRIIAPIPGKGTIGIEVPNKKPQVVSMESILNTKTFKESKMRLPIALGKTITNEVFMVDLAKIPHLLVAGATGMGKSVGLNVIISSLLYKKHPNELKFVLIDPKKVEFSIYNKIADHFMACLPENDDEPIITDVTKVVRTLNSLCALMDHRYDMLKIAGAKNIVEYNEKFVNHKLDLTKGHQYMPYIVVIIDEFGDLIMTAGKEIELPIARIAQLARAVGIHMVIATQRPTTKNITGKIKANFPGRIAFRVSQQIDSRTSLDRTGANQLVGRGDMLFLNGGEPVRVQCAFIDTPEIERLCDYISEQPGPVEPMELPEPVDSNDSSFEGGSTEVHELDPYFEEAARQIVLSQQGSTSMIQRRLSIGYNRAGRLMDQLQAAGIVGEAQGSKPREVLIQDENTLNSLLLKLRS